MMPNALKGRLILQQRPELRADLKTAFLDPSIRGVVAAIGGDDTYRTVPFLMADEQFKTAVRRSPKLFTGFSDTTINHLMFYQLDCKLLWPQFLKRLAELGRRCCRIPRRLGSVTLKILSRQALLAVPCGMTNEQISVNRRRNTAHDPHRNAPLRSVTVTDNQWTLLGGCLDSLWFMTTTRYPDERQVAEQFRLIPCAAEWRGKILFIETSDEQPQPDLFKRMLQRMRQLRFWQT